MQAKYHFYATLLDSFTWFRKSEKADAEQEFLNRVNRVKTPPSDAQLRGMAFEKLINYYAQRGLRPDGPVKAHDMEVAPELIEKFTKGMRAAARQVFVETVLETTHGGVRVYGFIDDLWAGVAYDTKTTGAYEFPKYLDAWQHPAYLTCLKGQADRFVYRITDFKDYYEEPYHYLPEDTERLLGVCVDLAEWLEHRRDQITDRKIFGLQPISTY